MLHMFHNTGIIKGTIICKFQMCEIAPGFNLQPEKLDSLDVFPLEIFA